MKKLSILFVLLLITSVFVFFYVREARNPFQSKPSFIVDFAKLPNGGLNRPDWDYFVGEPVYNNEQETYTDLSENSYVKNGILYIQAFKKEGGYTSAKISPKVNGQRVGFQAGKLEIVAKLPCGRGTWPAFWLLSRDNKYTQDLTDEQWAQDSYLWAKNGEIDMMEAAGSSCGEFSSDVHTYTSVVEGTDPNVGKAKISNPHEFHTFGLEWTLDHMTFTLDGKPYKTVLKGNDWPFDQPFYLMINLAMGGNVGGTIDDSDAKNWILAVKSITYYPLKPVQK